MNNRPHITRTSDRDDYCTPNKLFKKLDNVFKFTLDAAASRENAKHSNHFSIENSALKNEWYGSVFCNPPYSMKEEFLYQALKYQNQCKGIVFLVPNNARESKWWWDFAQRATEIVNLKPRVNFELDGEIKRGVGFASCLLIYWPTITTWQPRELYWKWNE